MPNMTIPDRAEIERIAAIRAPWCVSIYAPEGLGPEAAEQARIEAKTQLRSAVQQLEDAGVDREDIRAIESSVGGLLADHEFWQERTMSLAIFANGSSLTNFGLPVDLRPLCEVSDRFTIAPLAYAAQASLPVFILSLAQNSVRFIGVTPGRPVTEPPVPDLPHDLRSTVALDLTNDRDTLAHLRTSEDPKIRMQEYCRAIDRALHPLLVASARPLIIAAAEPLAGIYPSVNSYPHLAETVIAGNPEERSAEQLAEEAVPIIAAIREQQRAAVRTRFAETMPREFAVTSLADVATAATFAAIDTLMVDIDARTPGYLDEETGAVTVSAEQDTSNYALNDEIVRRALASGADIVVMAAEDIPGHGPAAAILRFPTRPTESPDSKE